MRRLVAQLGAWPGGDRLALVHGETGTGRKRVARWLHHLWWPDAPYVVLGCARNDIARFIHHDPPLDLRGYGTVVLDDFECLGPDLLMRFESFALSLGARSGWAIIAVCDDNFFRRLRTSAPGVTLARLAERGIAVPPLRDRRMDLPGLVRAILREPRRHAGQISSVSAAAIDALAAYDWPENVDELREVIEVGLLSNPASARLELEDLPERVRPAAARADAGALEVLPLADLEEQHILATLQHFGGHRGDTADALGIHVNTLCRKLAQYGVGRRRGARAR